MYSTLYLKSYKRYDLSKLVSLRMLFLREQVRNLRVQEFLRELIVGVAAPSDLEGSILVEIFYSVEGRDVEQVSSNLKIILLYLRLLISLLCLYILHTYIVHIFICLIYACAQLNICLGLFAHT